METDTWKFCISNAREEKHTVVIICLKFSKGSNKDDRICTLLTVTIYSLFYK